MKLRFFFLLLLAAHMAMGANRIFSPRVRSLTSTVDGDWMNRPVMMLGGQELLTIDFDELSHVYHRLTYRLEHCEADWSPSADLFESDWLEGFNDLPIDDYQNSINTTVLYTHYRLKIPNERCRLKMSGNYRLTVSDDEGGEQLLQVEFYVVEDAMTVGLEVSTNTDLDHNVSHQQVAMQVGYGALRVTNREEQLHTVVMQNWQEQQARRDVAPTFVSHNALVWNHCRELIFDSGNEYHKFEVLDVSHPTMGIDRIEWDGTSYQAYPYPATVSRNYLTDVDADGAFTIRNSDRSESDYTCDYVWVNYELQAPYSGPLYLDGQWATDAERDNYLMRYDGARGCYHTALLQKQGYYNYRYVTADGRLAPAEGSYFQTENRYQALVYYKETGGRTWRLVGYRAVELR